MKKLLLQYERDGYILLKKCIPKKECSKFINSDINKNLKKFKINLYNKKSWKNRKELIITDKNLGFPLNKKYANWNLFFNNFILKSFFNKLYRRKWKFSHYNLGWIHVRFPFYKSITTKFCNNWHLDGLHDDFINYKQGEVILPMITEVNKGGGGTIILKDSHKYIYDYINSNKRLNIHEKINQLSKKLQKLEIRCNAGDILIMNPFLIHGSSFCNKRNRIRFFFNICLEK